MKPLVALYKGTSALSRAIRCMNWGPYSHASWITKEATEIEAWRKGVTETPGLGANHGAKTKVDLFGLEPSRVYQPEEMQARADAAAREYLGRGYDYLGVLGFVVRSPALERGNRLFCSELIAKVTERAGAALVARIPAYKVFPTLLSYSPRLVLLAQVETPLTAGELRDTVALWDKPNG
jgi:hypothetical protein